MARKIKAGDKVAPKPDFHNQTVLFRWALSQLGAEDLKQFKDKYQISPNSAEGIDERTGLHRFHETIASALPLVGGRGAIQVDRLREYEQNILNHTKTINDARARHAKPAITWKYHQYLALLFTEMFLDRYFQDAGELRDSINKVIAERNQAAPWDELAISPFQTEPTGDDDADPRRQLARLAFWCATGSGKTLLMHVHVLQFRLHHQRAFEGGTWPRLDQIILVTPNDGLSAQHAEEFAQSGLESITVGEQGVDGLFSAQAQRSIKILSIHKFQEEHGKATVATEAFEGCNLVLVDEGHRGAGRGEDGKWMERRDQLARGGFCIEYSATFKEAIGNDPIMRDRYARSILFDYSYQGFYRDGYGKDFMILNLEDDRKQPQYLTAALLLYYQQLRVWADGGQAIKPFQIDKPLWVFVGHTVTGGSKDDQATVSDVVDVLLFFKQFLADSKQSIKSIQELLTVGFVDQAGRNLLAGRLNHLGEENDKAAQARKIHDGILTDLFNAPGGGTLGVQLLKGADGELALKVGNSEPFGVVNVGEPQKVAAACEGHGILKLADDAYRGSLFKGINRDDSRINLLVGSRKFTEGWNSWRVSSIGLMRMGRSEGTQIIQLFGRGVRLQGYRMCLRRSTALAEKPKPPANLRLVETLQVFGVKASYMNTFRDWILSEVPEGLETRIWDLPVVRTLPERKLKTLRLKEEIEGERVERGQAFRKLGPLVILRPPDETGPQDAWLRSHPAQLNWLPRIRGIAGQDDQISAAIGQMDALPRQTLKRVPMPFFDIDELVFGLETFKAISGLDRLHVDRKSVIQLLARDDWYELYASAEDLRLDRYENRSQWRRMAQQLLNVYARRFYRFCRSRWEAPYIEVADLTEDDPNLLDQYTIETTVQAGEEKDIDGIAKFVTDLGETLKKNPLSEWSRLDGRWRTIPFQGHLYQPLLYVGRNAEIRISPVALNPSEAKFVEDLATWCRTHSGCEVYLLRNQAVTGLGFFEAANYYPDFLLWVLDGDRQHLAFADPKGLHHYHQADPKIQFATRDIPRLQRIVDRQADLTLHAFILSNTPFASLNWPKENGHLMSKAEIEELGVLFQTDDPGEYIERMMSRLTSGTK